MVKNHIFVVEKRINDKKATIVYCFRDTNTVYFILAVFFLFEKFFLIFR